MVAPTAWWPTASRPVPSLQWRWPVAKPCCAMRGQITSGDRQAASMWVHGRGIAGRRPAGCPLRRRQSEGTDLPYRYLVSTDMQAQFMALKVVVARGASNVTAETIFENRFMHAGNAAPGARIHVEGKVAMIEGPGRRRAHPQRSRCGWPPTCGLRPARSLPPAGGRRYLIDRIYHLDRGMTAWSPKLGTPKVPAFQRALSESQ